MARTVVAHAIRLLDARDRLAVIVYDDEVALHSKAMSPMAMKAQHYASYTASRSRDASGKAKRMVSDRS